MRRWYVRLLWCVGIVNTVLLNVYLIGRSHLNVRSGLPMMAKRDFASQITLPLCDFNASQEVQTLECNKTVPTWQHLNAQFPMLEAGGHYKPPNCRATHNIAIIIPYRNREEHLKLFLQHMHPFLQAQQLEYTIYVVELVHEKGVMFNRALLLNVGYLESSKQNDTNCFVFHDVDMLPMNASISYTCKPNTVKHPSRYVRQNDFKIHYDLYLGGVLIVPENVFLKVNGFSNVYWGWGGEDDDMHHRLMKMRIPIERPVSDRIRYESWSHRHEAELVNRQEFIKKADQRMHKDGLNSAKYTVLHKEKRHLYTWIYVSTNQTDGSLRELQSIFRPNLKDKTGDGSKGIQRHGVKHLKEEKH